MRIIGGGARRWIGVAATVGLLAAPRLVLAESLFGDRDLIAAMELIDRDEDGEALTRLESVLTKQERGDVHVHARFLAARAALGVGAPDRALSHLEGLAEIIPEVADFIWAETGRAYRQSARWQEALAAWQRLLQAHPDSPLANEVRYGIADAYYALGDGARAEASYQAAVRGFSRTDRAAVARFNLARIAESAGRYGTAAEGYASFAFGRPSEFFAEPARHHLDALIAAKRAPAASFQRHLIRIDKLLDARSLEEAAAALKEVASLVTRRAYQLAYEERQAKLAFRNRDYDTAIELFAKLAEGASGSKQLEYKSWIARCYSAADRSEDAVRVYRELAEHYQQRSEGREALYKAAWLAFNGGDYAGAVKLFGEFVAAYPRDRTADEAQWYLAWTTYRMRDLPLALTALEKLRTRWPKSSLVPRAWYWEGRIMAELGRYPEARSAYKQAVAAAPLDYYGMLARQRMRELEDEMQPVAQHGEPVLFASLDMLPPLDSFPEVAASDAERPGYEPAPDDLPMHGVFEARSSVSLPWGASVFDWSSSAGKRMLRLITLNMHAAAADVVAKLPVLPGHDRETISYARARLLYSLGDFNAAYRIAAITFGDRIKQPPEPRSRRYFHIAYPDAHGELVEAAAREFRLSPLLILSVMRQESAFDDRARSWASAHGLMQIIPATAARIAEALQVEDFHSSLLQDPGLNVRFGAWYLAQLLHKYRGNVALAVAAYNAGPRAVSRWIDLHGDLTTDELVEEIPFRETRGYVRRVLSNLVVYSTIYGGTAPRIPERVPVYRDNIDF